jgi:hypothetical protein
MLTMNSLTQTEPIVNPLPELVLRLAGAREAYAETRREADAALTAFREAHADLFVAEGLAKDAMTAAELALREAILATYAETYDTRPAPGCSVRLISRLQYNAGEAFSWAKSHGLFILPESLDVKRFEAFCKAQPDEVCDFVGFVDDPQTTIATDLAAAVKEIEAGDDDDKAQ